MRGRWPSLIGRQVALQLAAIGVPWLQLTDPDVVEESNVATQGYMEADLGKPKVQATAELCRRLNESLSVDPVAQRFRRSMTVGNIVFSCVGSMDIRRLIRNAVKDSASSFCDGRMSAEALRVLTACNASSREHHPTRLFGSDEACQGSYAAKTTIYCANVAAGLMVAQFTKWLRPLPVDSDLQFNLLSAELTATSP